MLYRLCLANGCPRGEPVTFLDLIGGFDCILGIGQGLLRLGVMKSLYNVDG